MRSLVLISAFAALAYAQAPQYRAAAPPQYATQAAPAPQQYAPQAAAPQQNAAPKIAFNPAAVHFVQIGQKLEGDYKFGYDSGKQPDNSQSFREETRLPDGTVKGAYGFIDASGKQRIVRYTAGKNGFQADGDIYLDGAPKGTVPAGPQGVVAAPQAAQPAAPQYAAPQYSAPAAPQYSAPQQTYGYQPAAAAPAQGGYRAAAPAAAPSLPSFSAGGSSAEKKYEDGQYNPEFTKAGLYYPDIYEKLPAPGTAPRSREPAFVDPALFNYNIGAAKKQ